MTQENQNQNENSEDNEPNETWFNDQMSPLENDAAPIDRSAMERARAFAGDVWMQHDNDEVLAEDKSDDDLERDQSNATKREKRSGKSMIIKAMAVLTGIAALITAMFMAPQGNNTDQTLGARLDQALQPASLRLKIENGQTSTVLISNASEVRWEESATKYRIANASVLWNIDEESGTAESSDSPWHDPKSKRVDLISLIGLEDKSETIRKSVATSSETVDGITRYEFVSTGGVIIDAYFDSSDSVESQYGLLTELRCWPRGRNPNVQPIKMIFDARDIKVDDSKFIVAKHLTRDGRLGKVSDLDGIVTLRPKARERWSPAKPQMLLKPGDWLRTDARGANACAIELSGGLQLTVGPASLTELISPTEVRCYRGEAKLTASADATKPLKILGPLDSQATVEPGNSAHFSVDAEGSLVKVENTPKWLAGFEGSSAVDPIGSLIANIDGRDTPLSVGVHQVKVEIRDQIARTTIEETFVNRTNSRLEGVFHFPLPADASISGFGMWISGELVEADVVEKQRAREIYETILRERRDPGLLEWSGGNIFKARVFPIEAHSEKRIKIVYTQVLPMRSNSYRYTYGLRSEMLQTVPLRELSIDVQVHSKLPLKSAKCSTHSVRQQQTDHSAKLEFNAQQYTPTRDFEISCEVASNRNDVVVIPHERGEDGYFMVQLTPPESEAGSEQGRWQRELVPDGDPLDLILVCDTSASMDSQKRKDQQQFVTALLSGLSPEDRFNVAACDVDCTWLHGDSVPTTEDESKEAVDWLSERISLGWTDLDRMADSVYEKIGDSTQVIYVGDGIVTSGDADPQNFVGRLKRLAEIKAKAKADGKDDQKSSTTFHAVSVGSSFEPVVLNTLASIGGGSLRKIGGEETPQRVAAELLREITTPGITDLKVEFRGLKIAAVYPETLPNLSAGTQQILIGRYLPEGDAQNGQIIISGRRGDEEVNFTANISLAEAEKGNSFIPRLWARGHLDHLLAQGSSGLIQEEIIAMSEEFHIMTPYTSLLVLETDEDRERFGVKKRYLMRDGERFFADGTDNSKYELLQQQMKLASDWRLELRRQILADLVKLGRIQRPLQPYTNTPVVTMFNGQATGGFGGGGGGSFGAINGGGQIRSSSTLSREPIELYVGDSDAPGEISYRPYSRSSAGGEQFGLDLPTSGRLFSSRPQPNFLLGGADEMLSEKGQNRGTTFGPIVSGAIIDAGFSSFNYQNASGVIGQFQKAAESYFYGDRIYNQQNHNQWISRLFPSMPAPPSPTQMELEMPTGSAEALQLLESLQTGIEYDAGGLSITRNSKHFDVSFDRLSYEYVQRQLVAKKRWLEYLERANSETQVKWCNKKERGIYSKAFKTGQTRASTDLDLTSLEPNRPLATAEKLSTLATYDAQLLPVQQQREEPKNGISVITLTHRQSPKYRQRITIDTQRNVVTSIEVFNSETDDNTPAHTQKFSKYKKVAGAWWPQLIEKFDNNGKLTSTTDQEVKLLSAPAFGKQFKKALPDRDKVLLIANPMPTLRQSLIAVREGSADARDYLNLIADASSFQDWPTALKHLKNLQQVAADKQATQWIGAAVLHAARRNPESLTALRKLAEQVVGGEMADDPMLCQYLIERVGTLGDGNETLKMVDQLKQVFMRQPESTGGEYLWKSRRAYWLRSLKRPEVVELQREIATSTPWNTTEQILYAQDLIAAGERKAAYQWLDQYLDQHGEALSSQTVIRNQYAKMLIADGRNDALLTYLQSWIDSKAVENDHHFVYPQYLVALASAKGLEAADDTVRTWITDAQIEQPLTKDVRSRLNAAVKYATGQRHGNGIHKNWMDPAWEKSDAALFFLDSKNNFEEASAIVGQNHFNQTGASDQLYAEISQRLKANAANLDPKSIQTFVSWIIYRDDLSKDDWKVIFDTLKERWETAEAADRELLGSTILTICGQQLKDTELLPFHRLRLNRVVAEKDQRKTITYRAELFKTLLSQPWQQSWEDEAAKLIPELGIGTEEESATVAVSQQIAALMQFTDRMIGNRRSLRRQKMLETENPEQLTRTQYANTLAKHLKTAREGVTATLKRQFNDDSELSKWAKLETMHLNVKLRSDLDQIADDCWKILGEKPKDYSAKIMKAKSPEEKWQLTIEQQRMTRTLTIARYLAARGSASDDQRERVSQYIEAGTQLDSDKYLWQSLQYDWLIVLDQPDELRENLVRWIRTDPLPTKWQRGLARLEAELGNIDKAISIIESLRETARLIPQDQSALTDWYLVADRRKEYEQAKTDTFEASQEFELNNFIQNRVSIWQNTSQTMPTELDENVLFAFKALFRKSSNPEEYVSTLARFYKASRDFRMLQMVPDALMGQTPQRAYPMLRAMSSDLLELVLKEATADEMQQRIDELRATAESKLDSRALNLLDAMVAQRAAMVLNQPGPHIARATEALKNAFKGDGAEDWAEGEIRQMAEFLTEFNTPKMEALTKERLRQLRALRDLCEVGTDDRFYVSWQISVVLDQSSNDDQAIATIESAVNEVLPFHPEGVPVGLNKGMFKYVNMLNRRNRYAKSEGFLNERIEKSLNEAQRIAYTKELNETYVAAYRRSGKVSLGSGRKLYNPLQKLLLDQLEKAKTDSHRDSVIADIVIFYNSAAAEAESATREDVWKFVTETFPKTLKGQQSRQLESIGRMIPLVERTNGRIRALEFLIQRFESFPDYFHVGYQNPWEKFAYRIGEWRKSRGKKIGDLEPRLLAIVLDQLRQGLRRKSLSNRGIYRVGNRFWSEKEDDFMKVAEEVVAEFPDDARTLAYVARYMADGLERRGRAIEILTDANEKGLLKWSQLNDLVQYLQKERRYRKTIPILEKLISDRPDYLRHRTDLLKSYDGADELAKKKELLADTDAHFRKDGRWTEDTSHQLAQGCVNASLYKNAIGYFTEAIAMRKRSPEKSYGQFPQNTYTLSQYYHNRSEAWSKLGDTKQAVDSMMAAIVLWGGDENYRRNHIYALENILRKAKDLNKFVASVDKEAESTGQDSPLLRKYLGFAYARKGNHKKAITQLRIAIELQPSDVETHTKLIESLDKTKDKAGAIRQTLTLIDLDRHNLELYKKLAERLKNDDAMSERAITTIVEAAPNEAEHHQAIAEIRQTQDRWEDAILHWKHVAELRRLEPTGLMKLAEAQIHVGNDTAAEETLRKLDTEIWPDRFNDVDSEIKRMRKELLEK